MTKKNRPDSHAEAEIPTKPNPDISGFTQKADESFINAEFILDLVLQKVAHQQFVKEVIKKTVPYSCAYICMLSIEVSVPILNDYDQRYDDLIIKSEDIDEPVRFISEFIYLGSCKSRSVNTKKLKIKQEDFTLK